MINLINQPLILHIRLVSGSGDIKITKDGNVLLGEMVSYLINNCISFT